MGGWRAAECLAHERLNAHIAGLFPEGNAEVRRGIFGQTLADEDLCKVNAQICIIGRSRNGAPKRIDGTLSIPHRGSLARGRWSTQ